MMSYVTIAISFNQWKCKYVDRIALKVLFHFHINPYGLFPLDLSKRLGITGDALEMLLSQADDVET